MNALSWTVLDEIRDTLSKALADPDVRVIVFIGVGKAFIAGADISELNNYTVSWDWHVAWTWSFNLIDLPGGKTRFLVRGLAVWDPINPVVDFILDFLVVVPSCIMQMQMCRELKQISEGTHPALCIGHPE